MSNLKPGEVRSGGIFRPAMPSIVPPGSVIDDSEGDTIDLPISWGRKHGLPAHGSIGAGGYSDGR